MNFLKIFKTNLPGKIIPLILIILVAGTGYFAYQYFGQDEIALSIIEQNEKANKQLYSIADWKTYRNERYGFEIKYPKDWFVFEEDHGSVREKFIRFTSYSGSTDEFYTERSKNPDLTSKAYFIMVYSYDNSSSMSGFRKLESKYKKLANEKIVYNKGDSAITLYIVTQRSAEIDETWEWGFPEAYAFLEHENYSYVFYFGTKFKEEEENLEILKTALGSFKFIE